MTQETRQKPLINLHLLWRMEAMKNTQKTMPMDSLTRIAPRKSSSTHVRPQRTIQVTPTMTSEMNWMDKSWRPARGSSSKNGKLMMRHWMMLSQAWKEMRTKRKRKSAIRRKRRTREGPILSLRSASMTSHETTLSS